MIGRSKTLLIISKKEYIKIIKKNAERGFFDTATVSPVEKPDTLKLPIDTVTIVQSKVAPPFEVAQLKTDSLITLNEFLFETNSYKLRSEHYPELNTLADYLKLRPAFEVDITGHTDNVGVERRNVTLSTRRAEGVAEYLVSQGVDYNKVVFKGLGSSRPIASNETEEGRSKNRRVEILIRKQKK
jgi:outer membrane protein OmpA-like peptidoglycan-associated protein